MAALYKIQGILLLGDTLTVSNKAMNSQPVYLILIEYIAGLIVLFGIGNLIGNLSKHNKHKL